MARTAIHMSWHDSLFAHWPIDAAALRPLIPAQLEVDTFDGQAWIAVVPFRMTGVRHHLFPFPMAFPELNVRTYVRHKEHRGVWFFSLDAASWLTVRGARLTFGLPYFDAEMSCVVEGDSVAYQSCRSHRGDSEARLKMSYRPVGDVFHAQPGSLEEFLVERYCLFSKRRGEVLRGDIEHHPWPLQLALAEVEENTMVDGLGLSLPNRPPLLHFAKRLDVTGASPVPV